ncbi:MAG: amylo-alpha-1,6-glucosidase [Candidatus Thiodiazotropha sp. (ex Dulcina madagascariensis)]|nr:amylo-alpha-1,6-glucosidase [Candidatus Thiodiazotropha sp. (ex Dulcina madagascariensis)]
MVETVKPIRFGRDICGDLEQAERREWLLTNGKGAYAAGNIAASLTRRYHGLLIAPVPGAFDRHLMMAKADATLRVEGREWPLFTNRWFGNVIDPHGYRYLESFQLLGRMPVWRFAFGHLTLEIRLWMEQGQATTWVAYRITGGDDPADLNVNLLANRRGHHDNMPIRDSTASVTESGNGLTIHWPEGDTLYLHTTTATLEPWQHWYEGFQLSAEEERGLASLDNNLSVGRLSYRLKPGEWSGFAVTLEPTMNFDLPSAMQNFFDRDALLLNGGDADLFSSAPDWIRRLLLAADGFLIRRPLPSGNNGDSVIAGYPWFGDWGRDTMISLSGLTIATGRQDIARSILLSYADLADRGQLPNRFTEAGERAEYNTVDAALWYFEAWRAYVDATQDNLTLQEVYPILQAMIDWHLKGTRFGIGMDPEDHLLHAGEPGVQLTWMDAKVGEWVVTPRIGKPVEINALWFNALCIMAGFAKRLAKPDAPYRELADAVGISFQRFLRANHEGLYDLLDGPQGSDATVRPNQILAVSLPHTPLEISACRDVVSLCGQELLSSYGLRSLSSRDKDYRGQYKGGVADRDGAYHQGTAWAWLLGHYALAEYRVTGDASAAQQRLAPLADHLNDAGLGSISEIFDGDPPHKPWGAPAQAWSVACTLEAWWRLEQAKKL